jgi:uncharacterized protein (TIGR02996 family)
MSPARAFLADILDKPDDEAVRLIFADWLEERGDPRGPFIRLQCQLAHLPDDHPHRRDLEAEIQDLLLRHGEEWTAPLQELAEDWDLRGGFVESLRISVTTLVEAPDRLAEVFAAHPIRHLAVVLTDNVPRQAEVLARFEGLARVEHLELSTQLWQPALREPEAEQLLASPYLGRLRQLNLAGNAVGNSFIRKLVEAPLLGRLTSLDLSQIDSLGSQAARALAVASQARHLRRLRLAQTHIGIPGLVALLGSQALPAMQSLEAADIHWSQATGRALESLLEQTPAGCLLGRLRQLDLSGNELHPEVARAFFASPLLAGLTSLGLDRTALMWIGTERLAQSPHLANLTHLHLNGNNIGPEGVDALVQSPHLGRVTSLHLAGNSIRDSGAKALAGSPHLKWLTHLDLGKNGIGGPGWRTLLASPNLTHLRQLGMRENYVGIQALEALAASTHITKLTHLDLRDNQLEPDCARLLAGARTLANLHTLLLQNNRLGDDGAAVLARSPHLGRLAVLSLDSNEIAKPGADALADATGLGRLQRLELRQATITDTERQRLRARYGRRVSL